ncbi:hypothetical protein ABB37_07723 [Leptomonas pyrrhocoris]|uniref:Uncharacterized protein n=1 Tax=Leptomonas pyrrhocoris TaxID=157538 RepID=A0A0N0DT08_LEPPY|nr:hypothetical protein ABB37_07723 [Leptomonas pyrrhocoris]KPA76381.1 hypothetical protein ABB37_07723 [Leptomonas pyrrhocoris]|eukprot:XP_015654820.1 hypothetical protein ABB37_07723 [Leptomonas pyrrhocoris]
MWTRRKLFPTLDVPATPQPAAVVTPFFLEQQKRGAGDYTVGENAYHFLASLGYTLVPSLTAQEAAQLLAWALPPSWVDRTGSTTSSTAYKDAVSSLLKNEDVLRACSQVEYFLYGTDNGQVFLMPLLPPHLLQVLMAEAGDDVLPGLVQRCRREAQLLQAASSSAGAAPPAVHRVSANCVGRRLLHRHAREEPVTGLDHLGVLAASATASVDHAVALSIFHPTPAGVVSIAHPCPVRSLKLWEGAVFTAEEAEGNSDEDKDSADAGRRRRWLAQVRAAEPVAVYVFTGDSAGIVRLWRVDVVRRTYALQHVLVCSGNMTGMLSPLTPFAREDTTATVPSRASDCALHCLEIDAASHRLFGGTEGGAYVWALDALPWRGPGAVPTASHATSSSDSTNDANPTANETSDAAAPTPASLAVRHPLCWDEDHRSPLPCALRCWEAAAAPSAPSSPPGASTAKAVEYRAARLVTHHVWILDAAAVQAEMARARAQQRQGGGGGAGVRGWKAKYERVLTNGAAVGVVSNDVRLTAVDAESNNSAGVAARLTNSIVTVSFDGGEVKNDFRVPLSCVMPVVYPLTFLRTPGTACFALRVLAPRRRVLTSCADGRVCVWVSKPGEDAHAAETYAPQLLTEHRQAHRGLGRHLCVLRSPDIFVSASFDDGLVKEWHVYDAPEVLLRCARRFTLTPYVANGAMTAGGSGTGSAGSAEELTDIFKRIAQAGGEEERKGKTKKAETAGHAGDNGEEEEEEDAVAAVEDGDVVAGISCAAAYPAFGALFLVGAFESAIQTYSLTEVVGCEPPRNFIYNGHKTVHLPASMAEDVYHAL